MAKDYWTWICHHCGFDDNRNNNATCKKCGHLIRCESSGGHHYPAGEDWCSNGCGLNYNGNIDLSRRRSDY